MDLYSLGFTRLGISEENLCKSGERGQNGRHEGNCHGRSSQQSPSTIELEIQHPLHKMVKFMNNGTK